MGQATMRNEETRKETQTKNKKRIYGSGGFLGDRWGGLLGGSWSDFRGEGSGGGRGGIMGGIPTLQGSLKPPTVYFSSAPVVAVVKAATALVAG